MNMVKNNPNERINIEEIKNSEWYNGPIYDNQELFEIMNYKYSKIQSA